ncbi:hypothetical protein P280DRAFT_466754 [Massarina eburnea CBS 473.64]|uniref:Uncharacterized protein n=1 Tax=Massarina eburnea CBS 473.64 TaxID=1395130 RepID=A0A6A6SA27_9PLEO|nr:hypothetical protein P280DRAFT_466754 [Massarina eburnea CBS 473.64]
MSSVTFTSLPAEVRNAIYGFCTPLTGYIEDFKSLLLASKQISTEYQGEAVDVISKYIDSIERDWPHTKELHIDHPKKFSSLTSIIVQLPVSLYYPSNDTSIKDRNKLYRSNSRLEPCLASLFTLYLSDLTFTCYDDRPDDWSGLADVPTGLLYDLTNTLITPSALEISQQEIRTQRSFRLEKPVRVRRLCYKWYQHEKATGWSRLDVESHHTRFFLTEPLWWEVPNKQTLVRNWGSSSRDEVFFDVADA